VGVVLGLATGLYLLAPFRTNVLLLGIDRAPEGTALGRSDTIILTTFVPLEPYVGMLSVPRDLWVTIPGRGENRINAAHFFAESDRPGSGPDAAVETVRSNFGVDVDHYLRIRFDGFRRFVDALGGVEVTLSETMAGYEAGRHVLNGEQALAFVRNRQGTDDFFRLARGQLFLKAVFAQVLRPTTWPRLPGAALALFLAVDSDLPPWEWPRLGLTLLRAGPEGIDARTITHEMVHPFTTSGGAAVLAPDWTRINPVLMEMFGQ
jgi:LCP family protein required for cell wall assembly